MWNKVVPEYEVKEVSTTSPNIDVTISDTKWTVRRALFEVTLPVIPAIIVAFIIVAIMSQVVSWVLPTPEPAVEVRPAQLAVNRNLIVPIHTIDNRNLIATIKGRQIANFEEDDWCVYAWSGKIAEIASRAGTVFVGGQYHIDDIVAAREDGIEEALRYDLEGQSFRSDNCSYDILNVELQDQ